MKRHHGGLFAEHTGRPENPPPPPSLLLLLLLWNHADPKPTRRRCASPTTASYSFQSSWTVELSRSSSAGLKSLSRIVLMLFALRC